MLCQHNWCLWLCGLDGVMCIAKADHSDTHHWQHSMYQLGHSRLGDSIGKAAVNTLLFERGSWSL